MPRALRAPAALAATLALAALTVQAARADLNFSSEHDATYTLGVTDLAAFSDAQLLYNAADTVTGAPGDAGVYNVALLGDASTFSWTGANGLTVSNVAMTATTASATLASDGTPGTSGYNYVSNPGQGLISVGGGKLHFATASLDLAGSGATIVESIGLEGSWTTSAFTTLPGYGISFDLNGSSQTIENLVIGDKYAVSNLFTDSGFGFVRFDAVAATPEPGSLAFLGTLALGGLGLAARRRRSVR